jgi:2-oxo-4-hydroxy-4-carboxy-5-ureidoimidazoline decarboxylase
VTIDIAELNGMPVSGAAKALVACCGSRRWVKAMVARRPFKSREAVFAAADEIWHSLDPSDWLEAFAAHPRIGERSGISPQGERAGAWAAVEQSDVARAHRDVRNALEAVNYEYEARFGYIYIVCATGKSAELMLGLARERLNNSPDDELEVAAGEQEQIMRLRLDKLLARGEVS